MALCPNDHTVGFLHVKNTCEIKITSTPVHILHRSLLLQQIVPTASCNLPCNQQNSTKQKAALPSQCPLDRPKPPGEILTLMPRLYWQPVVSLFLLLSTLQPDTAITSISLQKKRGFHSKMIQGEKTLALPACSHKGCL